MPDFRIVTEQRRAVHGVWRFNTNVAVATLAETARSWCKESSGKYRHIHVGHDLIRRQRELRFVYVLDEGEDDKRHVANIERQLKDRFSLNHCGHEISTEEIMIVS